MKVFGEGSVKPYLKRGAVGAGIGAILGAGGAMRAASEGTLPADQWAVGAHATFGALVGFLGGLIYWRLRWLREGGRLGYYLSWAYSVGSAVGVVLLPETVTTGSWFQFLAGVALGVGGGLGLGLFTRQVHGHKW
jgi:hypothetical protein